MSGTASNPVEIAPARSGGGPGFASSLNVIGRVLEMVGRLRPAPPDALRVMQTRLAELELAKALNGGVLPFAIAEWNQVVGPEREDYAVIGSRGSGKTATAAAIGQTMQKHGWKVACAGWPKDAAEALGFETVREWQSLRDAVVLVDEAGIKQPTKRADADLWEAVALARHRGLAVVWTSQTMSGIHRDVLRLGVRVVAKRIDALAASFDREETSNLLASACAIQGRLGAAQRPAVTLMLINGQWCATEAPLPAGWSETVSRLWR